MITLEYQSILSKETGIMITLDRQKFLRKKNIYLNNHVRRTEVFQSTSATVVTLEGQRSLCRRTAITIALEGQKFLGKQMP